MAKKKKISFGPPSSLDCQRRGSRTRFAQVRSAAPRHPLSLDQFARQQTCGEDRFRGTRLHLAAVAEPGLGSPPCQRPRLPTLSRRAPNSSVLSPPCAGGPTRRLHSIRAAAAALPRESGAAGATRNQQGRIDAMLVPERGGGSRTAPVGGGICKRLHVVRARFLCPSRLLSIVGGRHFAQVRLASFTRCRTCEHRLKNIPLVRARVSKLSPSTRTQPQRPLPLGDRPLGRPHSIRAAAEAVQGDWSEGLRAGMCCDA